MENGTPRSNNSKRACPRAVLVLVAQAGIRDDYSQSTNLVCLAIDHDPEALRHAVKRHQVEALEKFWQPP